MGKGILQKSSYEKRNRRKKNTTRRALYSLTLRCNRNKGQCKRYTGFRSCLCSTRTNLENLPPLDNPYIIVQAFEKQRAYANRPALPDTPRLAKAYRQGLLDSNYGQSISFPSTYKCCFRLEVPVWSDVDNAHSPPEKTNASTTLAQPVLPAVENVAQPRGQGPPEADLTAADDVEEIERDEETYLVPAGYGCFSFRQGLLNRAARAYEVQSAGNKYEVIAAWLLEGLAVTVSRTSWNILSTARKCTMTDYYLLQNYISPKASRLGSPMMSSAPI